LSENPKGRTKQDIETLLGHFGFSLDHVTGSHHVYLSENQRVVIPIHKNKVKPAYVKQILDLLDLLYPSEGTDDADSE
jgi:predicted RNA binding protein YcfA (HicA-like mRNA interferase family)